MTVFLDRMEIEETGGGNPQRLAEAVLKQWPQARLPINVAAIARAAGIVEITVALLDGFEACLVTDPCKEEIPAGHDFLPARRKRSWEYDARNAGDSGFLPKYIIAPPGY